MLVVIVREWVFSDDGCPELPPLEPALAEIRTQLSNRLRIYVMGSAGLLSLGTANVVLLVAHSARGSPVEEEARKHVPAILKFKYSLIYPYSKLNFDSKGSEAESIFVKKIISL